MQTVAREMEYKVRDFIADHWDAIQFPVIFMGFQAAVVAFIIITH